MNKRNNKKSSARRSGKGKNERPEIQRIERALGLKSVQEPKFSVGRNLRSQFLHRPKGPYAGAALTLRQIAGTFTNQTGLSNVGSASNGPGQLIQNAGTVLPFAIAFELSDLASLSTLASLFDQYRIEKVKVHFTSRNNAISVQNVASPNGAVPSAFLVVDRDDSTALSGLSDCYQYDNCVRFTGEEDCDVELVPSLTPSLFASGAFSGYSTVPSNSVWVDIANTTVPAYGIKGVVGGVTLTTTSSWCWDIFAEYIISFRNSR